MTTEEELARLNSNIEKLLAISQLEYNFDQTRYLAGKVRAGEAVINKGAAYQLVAPAATFTVTLTNPTGFVLILHYLSAQASQNAVFELTITIDNQLEPWIFIPRFVDTELFISQVIPYDFVVKENTTIAYRNLDALPQWGVTTFIGTHLRKDVWERDIAIMNESAKIFRLAAPIPMPPRPPGE